MLYGSPAFVQDAATLALTRPLPEIKAMRERYQQRRDLVLGRLDRQRGLVCHKPAGGMFIMLDVRPSGQSAAGFAAGLLAEEGVAVLPGDAFGAPARGHVRLSLTASDERLQEACARIERYLHHHLPATAA
jgi:arginine:pyruvate transaminase